MSSKIKIKFPESATIFTSSLNSLQNLNDFHIIEILNCPSTLAASKLVSQAWFRSTLIKKIPSIIAIKLKILEQIEIKQAEKPKSHEFEDCEKILVSFESKDESVVYWKNSKNEEFYCLTISEDNLTTDDCSLCSFTVDFIIRSLKSNLTVSLKSNENQLTSLINSQNFNILMTSVNDENFEIFHQLLTFPFDINQKTIDGKTAADIAWQKNNQEIFLHLLQANSTYPKDFNVNHASIAVMIFLEIAESLHEAIFNNDRQKVEEILLQNSNQLHFYNSSNVSAITAAIAKVDYEYFELLTEHYVIFGQNENVDEIFTHFLRHQTKMKQKIRNLHSKLANNLPEKHIFILLTHSVISHDNKNSRRLSGLIRNSFEFLDTIEISNILMKIIATNRNAKIHFDFSQKFVQKFDPLNGAKSCGLTYSCGRIFIACKDLNDEQKKFEVFGIISHEFCHLVIYMVFRNDGLPYAVDDAKNKEKFEKIVEKIRNMKGNDLLIQWVFEFYPRRLWHAELIVRVPQLIVTYHNNFKKLMQLRETYFDLFDYFESFLMPKIVESLPIFEILSNPMNEINFNDLTSSIKAAVYHMEVKFQGQKVKLNQIVHNLEIYNFLTSQQLREILDDKNWFEFGKIEEIPDEFYIERNLINFESETTIKNMIFDMNIRDFVWNKTVKDKIMNLETVVNFAKEKKILLLSDVAGSGKSTTFRFLSKKLKKIFPTFWISYIDLKRHVDIYDKFKTPLNRNLNIQQQKLTTINILTSILNPPNNFEKALFEDLFKNNQTIFFLDGVDEISPKFKEFFLKVVEWIKNFTQNQLWIATRPQHVNELKEKFDQSAFKLIPYLKEEKKKLIEIVLIQKEIDIKRHSVIIGKIFSCFKGPLAEINNPLMLKLLAEIYIENQSNFNNFNLLSIYQAMLQAKKVILVREKGEIANLDRDIESKISIWDIHQVNALKLIIGENFEIFSSFQNLKNLSLFKKWKRQQSKWSPEAIARYGFLHIDHWETDQESPDFVHRTFAEFFVAKFIIDNIFEEDDEDLKIEEMNLRMQLLFYIIENKSDFAIIINFLKCYNLSQKCHPEILMFLKSSNVKQFLEKSFINEHFWPKIVVGLINLFQNDKEILKSLLLIDGSHPSALEIYFENLEKIDVFDIFRFFEMLEILLKNDWIENCGFKKVEGTQEFKEMTQNELDLLTVDIIKKFKDENANQIDKSRKSCQQFLKFLNFIKQFQISTKDFKNFIKFNLKEIFEIVARCSIVRNKFIDQIERFAELNREELKLKGGKLNFEICEIYSKILTEEFKFSCQKFCDEL
ncbi:hypothetical protein PVAND_014966 [Polypedilum vanderplanki]|uniref:NACHT domain-containing protein n=1 Tax=Polypedilum vanderplanki TaxID=319348 RepID=A0A9J6BB90_POLVA|nr:hypothetical protein PVAND_014966 [Polypedilum vanderplanki]